ncbi:MAG: glutamate racemase [Tissierellia bacterium]|nr:glutamate racemase [Tissierellia bacterium]
MTNRIGVFDSGVGGLTVLKALVKKMPNEKFYYFGDTKNIPYGIKTPAEIANLSVNAYKKLKDLGIKLLVIGCNTATVHGLAAIEEVADIPVIGVIEPGVMAAKENACKNILILATEATINSGLIQSLLRKEIQDVSIEGVGAPDMVLAVENGNSKNEKGKEVVDRYLNEIEISPDCVMLSCTHFPALEDFIVNYFDSINNPIKIINPAEKAAELAFDRLMEMEQLETKGEGEIDYFTSGDLDKFINSGNLVLSGDLIIERARNL